MGRCYNMGIDKEENSDLLTLGNQEGKRMAVSKATIGCIKSKDAKQFVEDIKNTKMNTDVILDCQELIKELMKAKENKM